MNFKYEVETLVKDDSILQSVYSDFEGGRHRKEMAMKNLLISKQIN